MHDCRTALAMVLPLIALSAQRPEPAPRTLTAVPIRTGDIEFASIAGARELPDGTILVSDAGGPAIYVIDPRAGIARTLGREGEGPNEYRRPGGIYPDTGGASFVVDRGLPRVLAIDRNGALSGTRSVEVRGFSSAADHTDPRRIDGALHTYFTDPGGAFGARPGRGGGDSVAILRYDVARQKADTVAMVGRTKPTIISSKDRMTISRTPIFSPADGWGVAHDGSVVIVRAAPYRVEWFAPNGRRTPGTAIAYTPVPVTAADREAFESSASGEGRMAIGQRTADGRTTTLSAPRLEREYAKTKPPFDPENIIVAHDGTVWVGRHLQANARQVVYDLFDRAGARVDRVALPARTRVVGFGPTSVYGAELDADDIPRLRRFALAK
jgi:sugar lactone lactonase YvrE